MRLTCRHFGRTSRPAAIRSPRWLLTAGRRSFSIILTLPLPIKPTAKWAAGCAASPSSPPKWALPSRRASRNRSMRSSSGPYPPVTRRCKTTATRPASWTQTGSPSYWAMPWAARNIISPPSASTCPNISIPCLPPRPSKIFPLKFSLHWCRDYLPACMPSCRPSPKTPCRANSPTSSPGGWQMFLISPAPTTSQTRPAPPPWQPCRVPLTGCALASSTQS